MRARTGKIARLPDPIRQELNHRLDNGALGRDLVAWLNALPEVQRVLAERFSGHPITDDNISQWRHGGFQDWLRQDERRVRLHELNSQYYQLDPALRARRLNAAMEERLALELTEELERLSTMKDPDERSKHLRRLCQQMCRLQNSRTSERHLRLLEAKAHHASRPPVLPLTRMDRADSDLPGPFRTQDYTGGGGKP
jgi:hypothetical protein